jgi:hypothetical protein
MSQHENSKTETISKLIDDSIYFQIEKNIPITHAINRPKWADKVREMRDGDSILLPTYHISRAFLRAASAQGVKVLTRKTNKGWRVWRIAK